MNNIITSIGKWFKRHSIRARLIVFLTLLVGIVSVSIYLYFPSRLKEQAIDSISDKANSIARMIAYDTTSTLVFSDKKDMDEILKNAKQNHDLHYLVIHKADGKIFYEYKIENAHKANYNKPKHKNPITYDQSVFRASYPIIHKGKKIGELYIGLSLEDLHQMIYKSKKATAVVSLIIFLLGGLLVFFTSTLITKPLDKMIETIEKISHGDLSHRVPFLSDDELGNLAQSFNLMIDNLESYSTELNRINDCLEDEVEERTKKLQVEINERKLAQEALSESEKKYRRLVDNSLVGIYIAHDYKIIFCNRRFVSIFGYENPYEIIGKNLKELIAREYWNLINLDDPGTAPIPTQTQRCELKGFRKDGTFFDIEMLQTYFIHREKTVFEGILIDITARKTAEEESRNLEEQLRQSQKMESLGTLAGGIAHDFNNILSAIVGYTELSLRLLNEDSKLKSHITRIMDASIRARDLVKQILAFSRKSAMECTHIHLEEIVKETLQLMQSTLPVTIEIQTAFDENDKPIFANRSEIHQVVMNLCSNAGHAMKEQGGILRVELSETRIQSEVLGLKGLAPGLYRRLTIRDTGIGIPQDVLGRIFEPYFTTKKSGEGTGMGLSVVHGIIKRYKGEISVYSEPGKGTTFNVYFPVADTYDLREEAVGLDSALGGTERILLVDDDPVLSQLGKEILSEYGYNVSNCLNAIEALELFSAQPGQFDLIITDQSMPKMTGIQLAEKIQKIAPQVPIILCSGFIDAVKEETIKKYGIDAFLMKPIIKNDLAHLIRKVLSTSKQPKTAS